MLYFGTLSVGSTIHAFCTFGLSAIVSFCCFFFPPLGLFLSGSASLAQILVCLFLTLFFWAPGMVYAYYCVFLALQDQGVEEKLFQN